MGGCWKVVADLLLVLSPSLLLLLLKQGWGQGLFNPRSGKASVFGSPHGVGPECMLCIRTYVACVSSQWGRSDHQLSNLATPPRQPPPHQLNFCNISNLNPTSHLELRVCPGPDVFGFQTSGCPCFHPSLPVFPRYSFPLVALVRASHMQATPHQVTLDSARLTTTRTVPTGIYVAHHY